MIRGWVAAAFVGWVVAVAAGCSQGPTSSSVAEVIPGIEFNGATYRAAIAPDARIDASDTHPIGSATRVDDASTVAGTDVFALEGVPPGVLVVMRSAAPANGAYVLFVRDGSLPRPSEETSSESTVDAFVASVPGLCRYFPETGC